MGGGLKTTMENWPAGCVLCWDANFNEVVTLFPFSFFLLVPAMIYGKVKEWEKLNAYFLKPHEN